MILETSFSHFSNFLFINLMNTLKIQNQNPIDLLLTEENVVQWITLMENKGLLNKKQVEFIKKDPINTNDIQHFRSQCREYFASNFSQNDFFELLSNVTKATPLSFTIDEKSLIPLPIEGGTKGLLSLIAYQMLDYETSGVLDKVKACESENCLAFFVNKKGKRKWCSMEVCGNRTKAKKHYHNKTKTPSSNE
ncbi:CGNR zinc finger domain-containing protein [Guptibacillus hwajinpoensis]|uniref:CGNR zinc finger domain-containing protein n=1 Tax=Guptibacillus hwajinpoensis TaxID=208199 RepID=UPI001CFDBB08|nr:CGNR zinc finger domain-containing protein [Pseudalkalibacillus hwajinpoensis]WLR59238.1 CGNR zinc finger domain-containing protein [Pseudalkalibacillus hwajinpoensis]